ncbi:MAG: SLBB domain-containing protein, partial [Bacteroidales bacterium]|nr:SLBB domain-containing protein [Bacteroidales bacterium]
PLDSLLLQSVYDKRSKIFGREIFSTYNLTFAPNYNMPTPANYILAAGDEVIIDVWGASEMNLTTTITPEGSITIPGLGLVYLNGLSVEQAEGKIRSSLKKIMSGIGSQTQVKVSLGQIRTIKVNMVGEATVPGTYSLPSLATLFNALYSAGGVNDIGSLRAIKVYRNNKEAGTLDLYDFLLNGRYDANIRLEDNDIVIVPTYQNLVTIKGKVKRNRTFEMTKDETLAELITYAGGTTGDAYTENVQVKRRTGRMFDIHTVNAGEFDSFLMHDGDSVFVDSIIHEYSNRLTIKGAVWRPGEYELCEKTDSLSELIGIAEGLKGDAFASRGQITRMKDDYTYEVIPFLTRNVVSGAIDIALKRNDEIYIPSIFDLREEYYLIVKGEVNLPDTIAFSEKMSIEDAIMQCGGLKESASVEKIEVARRIQGQAQYTPKTAEVFTFNIDRNLEIATETAGFVLQPFDEIIVRSSPGYQKQTSVYVYGEVLFKGEYVLASNSERLSDLVNKAGELTPDAYIQGAILKRKYSEEEIDKIKSMLRISRIDAEKKMDSNIKNLAGGYLNDSIDIDSIKIDQYYPVGIDLQTALKNPEGPQDIILMDDDQLYIPKYNGVVKISGVVLYPNAITYIKGKRLRAYLSKSGGYQDGARRKPYVVYMNGDVASTQSFLGIKTYPRIEPGCEIVVPAKLPKEDTNMAATMAMATTSVSLVSVMAMLINLFR